MMKAKLILMVCVGLLLISSASALNVRDDYDFRDIYSIYNVSNITADLISAHSYQGGSPFKITTSSSDGYHDVIIYNPSTNESARSDLYFDNGNEDATFIIGIRGQNNTERGENGAYIFTRNPSMQPFAFTSNTPAGINFNINEYENLSMSGVYNALTINNSGNYFKKDVITEGSIYASENSLYLGTGKISFNETSNKFVYYNDSGANVIVGAEGVWEQNGDAIYYNAGAVGIGKSYPTYKLDVNGSINIAEGASYLYGGVNALTLSKGTDSYYSSTIIGQDAGGTDVSSQTAIGNNAGLNNTKGYQTAVGAGAGQSNTGAYQTAVGADAGFENTGASQTAIGLNAGYNNTGFSQTALGMGAGQSNTGSYQTAIGNSAGYQNSGSSQTAMGHSAGYSNTGSSQTAIGYVAGYLNTGSAQTVLGYYAGRTNTGNRVTGIGYRATRENTGDDVVAIGYEAGYQNTEANQFIVQQANINSVPLIQGNFSSGNVGIGTTSPQNKLNVVGEINATEGFIVGSNTGYTGTCTNTIYSGGIAIGCND